MKIDIIETDRFITLWQASRLFSLQVEELYKFLEMIKPYVTDKTKIQFSDKNGLLEEFSEDNCFLKPLYNNLFLCLMNGHGSEFAKITVNGIYYVFNVISYDKELNTLSIEVRATLNVII